MVSVATIAFGWQPRANLDMALAPRELPGKHVTRLEDAWRHDTADAGLRAERAKAIFTVVSIGVVLLVTFLALYVVTM